MFILYGPSRPAPRLSRYLAGMLALVITVVALVLLSESSLDAPRVRFLSTVTLTAISVINGFIAYLVMIGFYDNPRPTYGLLGVAFAYSALMGLLQVASYPGVLTEAGVYPQLSGYSVWLWLARVAGFSLLITVSMCFFRVGTRPGRGSWRAGATLLLYLAAPVVAAAAVYGAVLRHGAELNSFLDPDGHYHALADGWPGWLLKTGWLVALASIVAFTRLSKGFFCWLALGCYAYLLNLLVNLSSAQRFTLGWYSSRFFELFASLVILSALFYEVLKMHRELRAAYQRTYELSIRDGLTGAHTRRFFDDALERELERQRREGAALSLLMIDIDHFKQYNDGFGHRQGDDTLRRVVDCLSAASRAGDVVARYGGEEFAIVLPRAHAGEAERVAERLRAAVEGLRIPAPSQAEGSGAVVTISVGVCALTAGYSADRLVRLADAALYEAKRAGRNRVVVAEAPAAP